jgi:hypothetical protein
VSDTIQSVTYRLHIPKIAERVLGALSAARRASLIIRLRHDHGSVTAGRKVSTGVDTNKCPRIAEIKIRMGFHSPLRGH